MRSSGRRHFAHRSRAHHTKKHAVGWRNNNFRWTSANLDRYYMRLKRVKCWLTWAFLASLFATHEYLKQFISIFHFNVFICILQFHFSFVFELCWFARLSHEWSSDHYSMLNNAVTCHISNTSIDTISRRTWILEYQISQTKHRTNGIMCSLSN